MRTHSSLAQPHTQAGFTLAEVATVLVIIGLLLGGIMMSLPAQLEEGRINNTQKLLTEANEALLVFAVSNGRLPCPATLTSNGQESFAVVNATGGGTCTNPYDGYLPAATLGLTHINQQKLAIDGWNQPLRYAVPNLAGAGAAANALTRLGPNGEPLFGQSIGVLNNALVTTAPAAARLPGIHVCTTASGINKAGAALGCAANSSLVNSAVALVFSTGNNRTASGADEAENLTSVDRFFVSHEMRETSGSGGSFDDQLVWVSSTQLLGRLVAGGRLP